MSCDEWLVCRSFQRYLRDRTTFELIMSFTCWVLLILGSGGRIVFLDKFREVTPQPSQPFALEWISDIFVFTFFLIAFLIHLAVNNPDLRYLRHQRGIACIIIAGFGFAGSFFLHGYSAINVDPALRHISALALVILTAIIAYFLQTGPGNGAWTWQHVICFLFCVGGVLLAGAGSLKRVPETMDTSSERSWFAIFILAYIPQAIALVAITYYFKRYLIFREQDPRHGHNNSNATNNVGEAGTATVGGTGDFVAIETHSSLHSVDDDNDDRFDYRAQKRIDPLTGKIVFAFFLSLVNIIVTLLLAPTDIAPFFGTSADATQGFNRTKSNFQCVFTPHSSSLPQEFHFNCQDAWRPFLELTASSVAMITGLMFALQRTPFAAAQALVFGSTSLQQLLRGSFPDELGDPAAKVGTTNLGESLGAVALSLVAVILTFVAEEAARLDSVPRREALEGTSGGSDSPSGERAPLVGGNGASGVSYEYRTRF